MKKASQQLKSLIPKSSTKSPNYVNDLHPILQIIYHQLKKLGYSPSIHEHIDLTHYLIIHHQYNIHHTKIKIKNQHIQLWATSSLSIQLTPIGDPECITKTLAHLQSANE